MWFAIDTVMKVKEFGAVKALAIAAGGAAALIAVIFAVIWVTYVIQDKKYEKELMEKQKQNDIPLQRSSWLG